MFSVVSVKFLWFRKALFSQNQGATAKNKNRGFLAQKLRAPFSHATRGPMFKRKNCEKKKPQNRTLQHVCIYIYIYTHLYTYTSTIFVAKFISDLMFAFWYLNSWSKFCFYSCSLMLNIFSIGGMNILKHYPKGCLWTIVFWGLKPPLL